MSKIPYFFETPVPTYFRENGWFKNPNTILFVTWAFSRCKIESHKTVMDSKEIQLEPFEFIAGRLTCHIECGLTEKQFRGQAELMQKEGILEKTANSKANRYTCYRWVTERFCKNEGQLKGQQRANSGPTKGHKSDNKISRSKKDHHPTQQLLKKKDLDDDLFGRMTDDSFLKRKVSTKQERSPKTDPIITEVIRPDSPAGEKKILQHNINYQHLVKDNPVEICEGVSLSEKDLDACIKIKGSFEMVQHAIKYIIKSPKRKKEIKNWPNALATWEIKNELQVNVAENQKIGEHLDKCYSKRWGWRCETFNDKLKGDCGVVFCNSSGVGDDESIFISYRDGEFKEKVLKVLEEKGMKKKVV